MLSTLTIDNVVLIDHLMIDFSKGLCALTGETGAGKSILLDSIGLAMGARAESRLVRRGTDKASVTAVFELNTTAHPLFAILDEGDISHDPTEPLILRRTLSADGKSRAYINDQPVSAAMLRQVGDTIIEIHGQFDTHGLLNPATHLALLDDYTAMKSDIAARYRAWKAAQTALDDLRQTADNLRTEEDYLREAIEDLDALNPQAGEEQTLSELRATLSYREQVLEALTMAHGMLNADDDPLARASGVLSRVADKGGAAVQTALDTLDQAVSLTQEAMVQMTLASDAISDEEHDLESIDERLHRLRMQARKHGCSVDDLADKRNELADQLSLIEHSDARLAEAMKQAELAKDAYVKEAKTVSKKRHDAAQKLAQLVQAELAPLKMEKARFVVDVTPLAEDKWSVNGMDSVRFLVATNVGAEPGPLNKIASGGEMARFMLALRVVMAQTNTGRTIIFDEIDSGVGGAVADAIGDRLVRLAHDHQVMVVTHSPQIAAKAMHHWIVSKDGVKTDVQYLETDALRRDEVARMLSGATVTTEAQAAAERLLGRVA